MRKAATLLTLALACAAFSASALRAVETPQAKIDLHAECDKLIANPEGLTDGQRQAKLFDLAFRYYMTEFPELATYVGYPGQNGRWSDGSLTAIERRKQDTLAIQKVVRSIDRAKLSDAEKLDDDLFGHRVDEQVEGQSFPEELMPISQLGGPQQDVASLIAVMPAGSVEQYEDILARLNGVPKLVDDTMVLLVKGLAKGITPPRVTLRDVPQQVENQIFTDPMASPLLKAFTAMPPAIPAAEQERLKQAAAEVYTAKVVPAFHKLHDYLVSTYLPGARESIGLGDLPNGKAWYGYRARVQTTTDLTPQQIHDIGLSEVKRIRAEMDQVIASTGFKGSFADFTNFLRTDPRFFFDKPEDLLTAYRDIAKRIDPELVKLFGHLPELTYGVVPVPAYAEKSQTTAYYQGGSLEAGRPGYFFANTYDLKTRPKWEMEALTMHEAVPGHHLQISIAQEQKDLPWFRRFGGYTAFVEGWGLYSESLGTEMGFYKDPYSHFGQLTYEAWRAVRLVVDTGMHTMGWTRQQAIDYFKANTAKTDHDIEVEIDRYIVDPGQALAYKLGELKLKELRAYAEKELGKGFDVRAFHDEVLDSGALPLDVLERRVHEWVAAQKAKAGSQPAAG